MSNLILGIILIFGCSVLSFLAGGIYGAIKMALVIAEHAEKNGKLEELQAIMERE